MTTQITSNDGSLHGSGASMRAIRVHRFGPPEVLELEDVPRPRPGNGEVRIRVSAAGLNYADVLVRAGRIPSVGLPDAPGFEAAGVVDEVGTGGNVPVGTPVDVKLTAQGAFAEYVVAPASEVVPLGPHLRADQAVALPIQGLTALLALRLGGRVQHGDAVFVPAAAGGVGSLAVQLAKRLGAGRVIGGASSHAKRGFSLGRTAEDVRSAALAELVNAAASGALQIVAGEQFPLAKAADAHRAMEARKTTGKVVLVP